MNLEQRVTMLEEEVQLLKNQIQTTLLAIQEQILSNTYPNLRGEGIEAVQLIEHVPEGSVNSQAAKGVDSLRGVNRVSFESADQPSVETPVVGKPASTPASASPSPKLLESEASLTSRQTAEIDWASLNKMDEWICRKIDKIGIHRTHRLIEFYAETKRFSENVTKTLLQLIALYEEDVDPAEEERHRNQPFNLDDTVTSFDPPIRTYYAESDMSSVHENREISARRQPDPESDFSGNGSTGHTDPDQPDAPRKMILKLIAGLQNAGMDWKHPNG